MTPPPTKRQRTLFMQRPLFWLFTILLIVLVFLHFNRQSLPWYFLTSTTTTTPKLVYRKEIVNINAILPDTLQLLQQNPELFWDCRLPETPCQYFYPHSFFQDNGPGAVFRLDYKTLGGNNKNLPAMTALSWCTTTTTTTSSLSGPASISENSDMTMIKIPRNISFIHIHKCGGTTVKALMARAKHQFNTANANYYAQAQIQNYKYSFGGGSQVQKERNQQARMDHIKGMLDLQEQQQQRPGGADHVRTTRGDFISSNDNQPPSSPSAIVFTIVRDPIERFISAVQQVMHYHEDFRQTCLKRTAKATMACSISYVKETNYLRDVHLLPMVSHFRLWDDHANAQVAVLHLHDIQVLAEYFRIILTKDANGNDNTSTSVVHTMLHGRDRSTVEYATSSVLAQMSVSRDCTPEMILQLCQLYAVDVVLMESLGYRSPYCTVTV